jgi:nucleoid-associated protein YgaU
MLGPVMLLVGVGVGVGVGMLISKPKLDDQTKQIDQLTTEMETSKAKSEETIQKADTEIARNKNELRRTKSMLTQLTAQLANAKSELKTLKSQLSDTPATSPETAEPVVVITTPGSTDKATSTTNTVDYTIEDGDSFWKIAQEQLGDGNRYKEILELNPDISENQTLVIGTIIKIPTQ